MTTRESSRSGVASKAKGQVRRRAIVKALRGLILTKGYAETSLSDLSQAAGMSVSHILYYFESKESVLEELCRNLASRLVAEITSKRDDPPELRLANLADYIFAGTSEEHRLTVEMLAVSMHHAKIRKIISDLNRELTAHLTRLFQQVSRPSGISAEDSAECARAVLTGLLNNSQFAPRLDQRHARRVYQQSLLNILGVDGPD